VILDEVLARRLFGNRDPLGERVRARGVTRDLTVVGVAANVSIGGPEREAGLQMYRPLGARGGGARQFIIRTSRQPARVVPTIQAVLARHLPAGREARVYVVEEAFRRITADRRFNAGLMATFGALALLIGSAGIYGLMASMVAQRTRELGVRVALGATPGRLARSVLADANRQLLVGLAIGLAAAWFASRMFAALLFGVAPTDAFVYVVVSGVLLVSGLAAALLPAVRASRVDPIVALRSQ
jgi:ABC-type antimicrobial peptide transport system permease subunit